MKMNNPYRGLPVIEAQVLVDYMKEITDAVEKLSGKMETLGHRVATLETHLNQPHKSLPTNSRSFKMPAYQKPVSHLKKRQSSKKDTPAVQQELQSVMSHGVVLKPVAEAKREEFHNLHAAVHSEFKRIDVNSINPMNNGNKDNNGNESQLKLKKYLEEDLEDALGEIRRKFIE